jgi:hypothetical protein
MLFRRIVMLCSGCWRYSGRRISAMRPPRIASVSASTLPSIR